MTLWVIRQWVVAFLMLMPCLMPCAVMAQSPSPAATSSEQLLRLGELDALVAPIALYPDALLAEVLMASTYPLELVQAERWATENKASGPTRPIRRTISRRPATSPQGSLRPELHSAPHMPSAAGHLGGIIGTVESIGATTTSP